MKSVGYKFFLLLSVGFLVAINSLKPNGSYLLNSALAATPHSLARPVEWCYIIPQLNLDDPIYHMQGWLELYDTKTEISASPLVNFLLYLAPAPNSATAHQVVEKLRQLPEFPNADVITWGARRNGIYLNRYAGAVPKPVIDLLANMGYQPNIVRLYDAYNQATILVRNARKLDIQAFSKTFPSYLLLPVLCK